MLLGKQSVSARVARESLHSSTHAVVVWPARGRIMEKGWCMEMASGRPSARACHLCLGVVEGDAL